MELDLRSSGLREESGAEPSKAKIMPLFVNKTNAAEDKRVARRQFVFGEKNRKGPFEFEERSRNALKAE